MLNDDLGGGFKYLLFSSLPRKCSNLTNIFQMGWNHQVVIDIYDTFMKFVSKNWRWYLFHRLKWVEDPWKPGLTEQPFCLTKTSQTKILFVHHSIADNLWSCSFWSPISPVHFGSHLKHFWIYVYRLSDLMFAFWRDLITFLLGLRNQPLYRRCLLKLKPHSSFMKHTRRKQTGAGLILLMEEILYHLGCIKPRKWDKLPTSTG